MSITYIENLSNEIFYEIFEYLDAFKLYKAFSHLNIRFENLLHYSSFLLKFIDDTKSTPQFKRRCKHFIIPNRNRLYSLYFNRQLFIDIFFTLCTADSSFKRLESLVINKIESHQCQELLPKLINLPCLFSLSVQLDDDRVQAIDIYQLIFRLPFLKYNHLAIKNSTERSILKSSMENAQSSLIEHLNIEHYITVNRLMSLLSYIPQLRRLTCEQLFPSNENHGREILPTLSNLTHISIQMCNLTFNQFERFIVKISSQIQVLHVHISKNLAYLDANLWEQLIVQHLPQLKKFNFEYRGALNGCFLNQSNRPQINRFISSFWIERRWMFELNIDANGISYSIHPYKPTWFDFYERKETDENFIRPNVTTHFSGEWNQSSIDIINPIFSLIQITYLNIDCSQINLLTFIKLLHHLPNIDALRLSFGSSLLSTSLYAKRSGIIHTISNKTHIIKVSINKMTDIGEIQLVIDLCPRMKYLEIDNINEMDLILLLRFILTQKIKNCIRYLDTLYLHGRNLDNDMIEKLRRINNFEGLPMDYVIDCLQDTIILNWKPQLFH